MKELSIEEKAKRYDEAKLQMSAAYNSNRCTIGFMNEIFPELAESEDERTIKEIVTYLKSVIANKGYRDKFIESWIAWLENAQYAIEHAKREGFQLGYKAGIEKQGEKTEPIEDFDTEFERQISHLVASAINKEHEYNQGYVKWAAQSLIEYAKREIEKQGEEKPIKEHDVCDFCENRYGCVNPCPTKLIEEQKPVDKIEHKFKVGDIIKPKDGGHEPWQIMQVDMFDKKYRFKDGYVVHFSQEDAYELVEQKSSWSEEDELHIKELERLVKQVWAIAEHENDKETIHKMSDLSFFLKTLKPQLKQEWSEEDIDNIKNIIFLCNNSIEGIEYTWIPSQAAKIKELMESILYSSKLQPQWKPSDEQMDALDDVISSRDIKYDVLSELWKDLEKLKDE